MHCGFIKISDSDELNRNIIYTDGILYVNVAERMKKRDYFKNQFLTTIANPSADSIQTFFLKYKLLSLIALSLINDKCISDM